MSDKHEWRLGQWGKIVSEDGFEEKGKFIGDYGAVIEVTSLSCVITVRPGYSVRVLQSDLEYMTEVK